MKNFWQKFKKPIYALAPMAGITDSAFRQICKNYGADLVYKFKNSTLGINLSLNYSPLRGKGTWDFRIDECMYDSPTITSDVITKMDIYSIGVGASKWFSYGKIEQSISVQFLYNYLGEVRHFVISNNNEHFGDAYGSRYGFRFGTGFYYEIMTRILLNTQIHYELNALLNRNEDEDEFNTLSIQLGLSYQLF